MRIKLAIAFATLLATGTSHAGAVLPMGKPPADLMRAVDLTFPPGEQPALKSEATLVGAFSESEPGWLVHIGEYGGDGSRSGEIVIVYWLFYGKPVKVLQTDLEFAKVVPTANGFILSGKKVISLCHVCDGWGAAEQKDLFFVPIEFRYPGGSSAVLLNDQERTDFLNRIKVQLGLNIKEQEQWDHEGLYRQFARYKIEVASNLLLHPNQPLHPDALTRAGERRR